MSLDSWLHSSGLLTSPFGKKKRKKRGMIFPTFSKPTPSLTQKHGKKGQIHKKKKKAQRSGVESNDKRRE